MAIAALDVIRIFDQTTDPPKPKMVVCVEPTEDWFFRINSGPRFRPNFLLPREPHHRGFLAYDSFVECSILELSEHDIRDALNKRGGVIGRVHEAHKAEIVHWSSRAPDITHDEKTKIAAAMR